MSYSLEQIKQNFIRIRRNQLRISSIIIIIPLLISVYGIMDPAGLYNSFRQPDKQIHPQHHPITLGLDFQGGIRVVYQAKNHEKYSADEISSKLELSKSIFEERLKDYGNLEAEVKVDNEGKRIVLEIPGVSDYEKISGIIGNPATLEQYVVNPEFEPFRFLGNILPDSLRESLILTKQDLELAYIVEKPYRHVVLRLYENSIDPVLSKLVENRGGTIVTLVGDTVMDYMGISSTFAHSKGRTYKNKEDRDVLSISRTNADLPKEQAELSEIILNWPAFPIDLEVIEREKIGSHLSEKQMNVGLGALIVGIILMMGLLLIFYGTYLGLIGCIGLMYSGVILYGIFTITGLVLNLPGLAGLILTVGISVDIFIIFFEAIKGPIRAKMRPEIDEHPYFDIYDVWNSFEKRYPLMTRLRLTTLFGTFPLLLFHGPIRGFAVTIIAGLIISYLVSLKPFLGSFIYLLRKNAEEVNHNPYKGRSIFGIPIFEGKIVEGIFRKILQYKDALKIISISCALISILIIRFVGFNLSNDFTDGTELKIEIENLTDISPVADRIEAFFNERDIKKYSTQEIRNFGSDSKSILIKSESITEERIFELIDGLEDSGFQIPSYEDHTISGLVNRETQLAWFLAIGISLLAVFAACLIFKVRVGHFRFAPSIITVLAVVHDLLITLGLISIFQIEMSIPVFIALLLLIGYSVNDTIVLIDRVDAKLAISKKQTVKYQSSTGKIVDDAVIDTRSRTMNTTLTTLIGLIPLLFFNITFLTPFVVVIMIGLFVGTYSSIFFVNPFLETVGKKELVLEEGTYNKIPTI